MKLTLADGRAIFLSQLRQWGTYAGLLAGRPDRRMNDRLVAELADEARGLVPEGATPVVLTDVLAPGALEGRLPGVTTLAVFESGELKRQPSEPYSSAVVAWFQGGFGLPDERTLARIAAIDWEAVAVDWMP